MLFTSRMLPRRQDLLACGKKAGALRAPRAVACLDYNAQPRLWLRHADRACYFGGSAAPARNERDDFPDQVRNQKNHLPGTDDDETSFLQSDRADDSARDVLGARRLRRQAATGAAAVEPGITGVGSTGRRRGLRTGSEAAGKRSINQHARSGKISTSTRSLNSAWQGGRSTRMPLAANSDCRKPVACAARNT